jgi:hypothetical protein
MQSLYVHMNGVLIRSRLPDEGGRLRGLLLVEPRCPCDKLRQMGGKTICQSGGHGMAGQDAR